MVKKVTAIISTLFLLVLFTILASQAVSAVNYCGVGATLPSNPYSWTSPPTAYLFNQTSNVTRIDTACWTPGMPWEDISIVYKPFPNQCQSGYNALCTEDTENYSSSRMYYWTNTTKRYCVNTDNLVYRWVYANGGLREFQNNYTEICSGGTSSIDNSCRAQIYFNVTRNGAVNYSSWNYTGTPFYVNRDVDAFSPTCYGAIRGTVFDANTSVLANVNVTLIISGPGVEQTFNSTLTNSTGQYQFNAIPATDYRILFTKTNYNSEIVQNKVNYTNVSYVNATLSSGSCNYDCTTQADPSRCSAACNGVAGCGFYNTTVATLLDGAIVNTQRVLTMGGSNYTVSACEGAPTAYAAPSVRSASISCPLGTSLIVLERIVLYNGQPVKVVVPVCRSS